MSILAGVHAALAAFHNATGESLPCMELEQRVYELLCDELAVQNVGRAGYVRVYPSMVQVMGCEIWRR